MNAPARAFDRWPRALTRKAQKTAMSVSRRTASKSGKRSDTDISPDSLVARVQSMVPPLGSETGKAGSSHGTARSSRAACNNMLAWCSQGSDSRKRLMRASDWQERANVTTRRSASRHTLLLTTTSAPAPSWSVARASAQKPSAATASATRTGLTTSDRHRSTRTNPHSRRDRYHGLRRRNTRRSLPPLQQRTRYKDQRSALPPQQRSCGGIYKHD